MAKELDYLIEMQGAAGLGVLKKSGVTLCGASTSGLVFDGFCHLSASGDLEATVVAEATAMCLDAASPASDGEWPPGSSFEASFPLPRQGNVVEATFTGILGNRLAKITAMAAVDEVEID